MIINTKSPRFQRVALSVGSAGVALTVLVGCTSSTTDAQHKSQNISNAIGIAANNEAPYNLKEITALGFEEVHLLNEHLARESDVHALRYVVLLSPQTLAPAAQWPIQGMVFDPNSQITNTQNIENGYANSSANSNVVDSIGDNGTYGPEAGSAAFYTTTGVEIQLPSTALWVESDALLNIVGKPVINYNVNETPSVSHGNGVSVGGK